MSTISVTNINDGDAVTASSINNQINTIVNDYNGNITAANLAATTITYAKLAATIFSGQATTDTNPGTGLGTRNLVNLGGIKILWGTTTAQTLGVNGNLTLGITFGTTFTTAPTMISIPYNPPDNRCSAVTAATTTTTGAILLQSNGSATNNVAAMWFAIGI